MSFIIGADVRVAAARSAVLLGLRGKVVLESMHTITIRADGKRKVTLPKKGSALELSDGTILIGDDLEGRLEDRIAVSARPGRRGAGRTR
ncbi:MAG TPA: ribonuclease P protein subunit [Nitrososphaerales archaeon]|nr:ribonuclease P protein subunit [Nitrososphaerales archaeon]